jgi:hypothetical protein
MIAKLVDFKVFCPKSIRMKRSIKLQFLSPAALFAFVMAAEGAAWGLDRNPTSEILWYLNLEIFPVLQKSYYHLSAYVNIPYFQPYCIAAPLFALACGGLATARAFLLAVASCLSFVYAFFLAYCWATANPRLEAASLGQVSLPSSSLPSGPGVWLVVGALLFASLAQFAISHFCYIRAIRPSQ